MYTHINVLIKCLVVAQQVEGGGGGGGGGGAVSGSIGDLLAFTLELFFFRGFSCSQV